MHQTIPGIIRSHAPTDIAGWGSLTKRSINHDYRLYLRRDRRGRPGGPVYQTTGEVRQMSEYIEREAAMAAIRGLYPGSPLLKRNLEWWSQKNKAYIECERTVQSLPATDVAPVRHGRLIMDGYHDKPCVCSVCGEPCKDAALGNPWWNYCPSCGAKMDGGET